METVKECMLAVIDEVVIDQKVKDSVTSAIKKVPISDTTTLRRVELLAKDVSGKLLENLRKAEFISIAVDESTDCTDMAQLCIYVRFFDGVCFREELLGLIPWEGHTTGEVIFQKIVSFFNELQLDLKKVCLLVTDGAPAMIGRVQGLVARLSAIAPHMQYLHCIIHQSVLCAKLSGDLKNIMDTVMNIVNLIRSISSLQHRLFRLLTRLLNTRTYSSITMSDGSAKERSWMVSVNSTRRLCLSFARVSTNELQTFWSAC